MANGSIIFDRVVGKIKPMHAVNNGPAIANLRENGKWFENFLAFMAEGERVPIDFFSWHIYAPNVEKVEERAEIIRNTLDRFGYR